MSELDEKTMNAVKAIGDAHSIAQEVRALGQVIEAATPPPPAAPVRLGTSTRVGVDRVCVCGHSLVCHNRQGACMDGDGCIGFEPAED